MSDQKWSDATVCEIIRREMKRRRLSVYELAKRANVSNQSLGCYLRGEVGMTSASLFAIFRVLGLQLDDRASERPIKEINI